MPPISRTTVSPAVSNEESPKFLKPKILAVDCDEQIVRKLTSKGYNAVAGTFGRPYRVKMDDGVSPVIAKPKLPNLQEQEVVIIDLSPPDSLSDPEGEKNTALGAKDVWASNQRGVIDPRPRVMLGVREVFDRIVASGGVFIVFSEPILHQEHFLARADNYRGLYDDRPIEIDNWAFLSLLNDEHLQKTSGSGLEVQIEGKPNAISTTLGRFLIDVRYTVTFQPTYRLDKNRGGAVFISLAKNKFGDSVAGLIVMPDAKGTVILLPHVADKSALIGEFVESLLPSLLPHLFPFDEANNWLHSPTYEHPAVIAMTREQEQIQAEANLAIQKIEEKIGEERERLGYLHRLLTGSGQQLVDDVAEVLQVLGFQSVVDADAVIEENANKQEDLQIHDQSPTLLVEVKGLSGLPTESDTIQVIKYIPRRMKEWGRTDVAGVVVVNHQKALPPADRDHNRVFTTQQVEDAINHDVLLVTAWELFKLARATLDYDWPAEALLPLFYSKGRIAAVPAHWTELGEVAHYYDGINVASIELTAPMVAGCRIGFALTTRFLEEAATQLQVNKQFVPKAAAGQRVGIRTSLTRREIPVGTKCYLVNEGQG